MPVVFVLVPDPVGAGFVDSLARPGGNITGFTQFEYSMGVKWLELLKQLAPSVTRAAVLRDPSDIRHRPVRRNPGRRGVVRCRGGPLGVRDASDIERAIAAFAREANDGLIVTREGGRPFIAN